MKLNLILVFFLPYILCNEEIIGFNLTSQSLNFPQNYVKISPDSFSRFLNQVTICLRVKFQFWNTNGIFESSSIALKSFPIFSGNLRIENFWYTFRWPDRDNISFRAFQSICLGINTEDGTLELHINEKPALVKNNDELLKTANIKLDQQIIIHGFGGIITDLNVWSTLLTYQEVKNYSKGFYLNQTLGKTLINWQKPNVIEIGDSTTEIKILKKDIVNSLKGECRQFLNRFTCNVIFTLVSKVFWIAGQSTHYIPRPP